MGKYMRKCRGKAPRPGAAVELRAQVVVGVLTRSRSAAISKRRRQAATSRVAEEALGRDVNGGAAGCYLHLRSRRLFMAAAPVVALAPRGSLSTEPASPVALADSREEIVAGISRCSSTASSVDVAAVRERSSGAAEACENCGVDKSSDSGYGNRERRETTPSSDLDSSRQVAGEQKHQRRRRSPATTSTAAATFHAAARANMLPPAAAAEIEEFFAAAEKKGAERFAAKYNFDVAHGVPLSGGRFEWTRTDGLWLRRR